MPEQDNSDAVTRSTTEAVTPSRAISLGNDLPRRSLLRLGALGVTGGALLTAKSLWAPGLAERGLLSPNGAFAATSTALVDIAFYIEAFPTSPLVLSPFTDPLTVPEPLKPEPPSAYLSWTQTPGPGDGRQNSCATSGTRSGRARSAIPTRSSTRST